ncbi:MAG: dipeptidase [Blastocatellia bacterium]|jgi:dipeptidase E|nr:dipeptidase [Blastocatellia bacterium]
MSRKRLLLLSNSTNHGGPFLGFAEIFIRDFLGATTGPALFVPFAAVRFSYEDYAARVRQRFAPWGYELESLHASDNPQAALERAAALVVGGGNTFQLLRTLYDNNLLDAIRARVAAGLPYIGWSAGANLACPTIKTTNDMPIVEPPSLNALGLVPFQINPHYTSAVLTGHSGETRAERLAEFIEINPGVRVVGLREGSGLRVEGASVSLLGDKVATVFIKGQEPRDYAAGESLNFLLG